MPKKTDVITYYDPATGLLARRTVEVDVEDTPPAKTETVKIGNGKSVVIQLGPTPKEAFAVFGQNPAFHEDGPDAWDRAARTSLELWAAKGNRTVTRLINEHGRPMNLKLEYE